MPVSVESRLSQKKSLLRNGFRFILAMSAIVGLGCSIYYNRQLSELTREKDQLRETVGYLDVEDVDSVVITRIPVSEEAVPPGVEEAFVWQYRVYFPAGYGPCCTTQSGLIRADTPQGHRGGSSGSYSGSQPEAKKSVLTAALVKDEGKWLFCRTTDGSSSASWLPSEFTFESLDDLVIEPVVEQGESRVFAPGEAICLVRLRQKDLATKRDGTPEKDLYRGFGVYVYGTKYQQAFSDWVAGKTDAMQEPPQ